ncbi:hypothetical protein ABIA69_001339 [Lysinibacillus parviboronicapiens]|uniref:DUF4275 family protein n=1 Tax=Lysinibacillus parviboronicapiens TaxID=436516 RepID=A0ABV2PH14_9BACI
MVREIINHILDSLPQEELEKIHYLLQDIEEDYLFRKHLTDKGVIISACEEPQAILTAWDSIFAKNINEETRQSIFYEQFKWHIFSYEQQACLKRDEARKAFDDVAKDELFVLYQCMPNVHQFSAAQHVVAADFDSQQDIYIVNRDFTWTYVHTHEEQCGPYFYNINA